MQNSGPWDPWLPVVRNSRLFAQRGHSARCAPKVLNGACSRRPQPESRHGNAYEHFQPLKEQIGLGERGLRMAWLGIRPLLSHRGGGGGNRSFGQLTHPQNEKIHHEGEKGGSQSQGSGLSRGHVIQSKLSWWHCLAHSMICDSGRKKRKSWEVLNWVRGVRGFHFLPPTGWHPQSHSWCHLFILMGSGDSGPF